MLEVERLTHSFDSLCVLDNLSFEVEEGAFICIVGPNGCGKTTLLRLIAGLLRPVEGEMRLNGRLITGPGSSRGFVFQEYALFPWRNVRQNIEFGLELRGMSPEERRKVSDRYIHLTGLSGFEKYRPGRLSGGMKQRVSIARALANNPQVILMDEPFAALDCQTRNLMQEELLQVWEKDRKTILFVTHNVEEAVFLGDRVLVLTRRPARLYQEIPINIPRPRDRVSVELHGIRSRILGLLANQGEDERQIVDDPVQSGVDPHFNSKGNN